MEIFCALMVLVPFVIDFKNTEFNWTNFRSPRAEKTSIFLIILDLFKTSFFEHFTFDYSHSFLNTFLLKWRFLPGNAERFWKKVYLFLLTIIRRRLRKRGVNMIALCSTTIKRNTKMRQGFAVLSHAHLHTQVLPFDSWGMFPGKKLIRQFILIFRCYAMVPTVTYWNHSRGLQQIP